MQLHIESLDSCPCRQHTGAAKWLYAVNISLHSRVKPAREAGTEREREREGQTTWATTSAEVHLEELLPGSGNSCGNFVAAANIISNSISSPLPSPALPHSFPATCLAYFQEFKQKQKCCLASFFLPLLLLLFCSYNSS